MASKFTAYESAVWCGGLLPVPLLAYQWWANELGANPIDAAFKQLGLMALIALMASLGCTPLQLLFKWSWPARVRKALGLLGALYVTLHLFMYAIVDHQADLSVLWADVLKRPYVTLGFAAWLLLIPLVVTSTNAAVRRLGFVRWKRLHRLAYVCGALGVIHFLWSQKKDHTEPLIYAAVLVIGFVVRWVKRKPTPKRRPASQDA